MQLDPLFGRVVDARGGRLGLADGVRHNDGLFRVVVVLRLAANDDIRPGHKPAFHLIAGGVAVIVGIEEHLTRD